MARAVLEGRAFALRDAMITLGDWVPGFERSIFVGGGVHSPTWLRIVSDVLAMDGEVPATADASLGVAMLAGVWAGLFSDPDDSVARCYRRRERLEHSVAHATAYADLFEGYLETRPAAGGAA